MKTQSFIFIGRSGCGKGTQVELLKEVLKAKDPEHDILYIYTGDELRKFILGENKTQQLAKKIYEAGGLMPEFLAVYTWSHILVDKYDGNQHVIFDGTPRRYHEAGVLDSVFDYYDFGNPWVIYINISSEEAKKRLLLRKRSDDNEEDIQKRLDWFEADVLATISFYRDNPRYNFIEINGEQDPKSVHGDIVNRLGLL